MRELGREASRRLKRAVFLDRDGVLIHDVHLLSRKDQVQLFQGTPAALMALHEAGFALVVATNQTVVSRGLVTEQDVHEIHDRIQDLLLSAGCQVDRFYFCPHHPNAKVAAYRRECPCRKPRPGMLQQAATELGLDLTSSWMIGDRVSDVVAGHLAGSRTILVETGMHLAPSIESDAMSSVAPDHQCADIAAAAKIILESAA